MGTKTREGRGNLDNVIRVRLPADLKRWVETIAATTERTQSWVVRSSLMRARTMRLLE